MNSMQLDVARHEMTRRMRDADETRRRRLARAGARRSASGLARHVQ